MYSNLQYQNAIFKFYNQKYVHTLMTTLGSRSKIYDLTYNQWTWTNFQERPLVHDELEGSVAKKTQAIKLTFSKLNL